MNNSKSSRKLPSSMPCPNCKRLISTRTDRCIHCGYRLPRVTTSIPFLGELLNERVSFVNGILIACFVLYALGIALDLPSAMQFGGLFDTLSPTPQALIKLGMGGFIPLMQGKWWTLLTATYLHLGILHILFNMLWLRQLGPLVEELYGASRFIVIYTVSGLTGSLVSALIGKTPYFVGASGAVFGLFGALIYYGLHRGGTFGSTIFRQMVLWAVIGLALGFTRSGVDNWGHLGGIAGGALTAIILGYQERKRQQLSHHIAALLMLLLIVVCFGIVFITFFTGGSSG
jgi:rhomboid protease GluP